MVVLYVVGVVVIVDAVVAIVVVGGGVAIAIVASVGDACAAFVVEVVVVIVFVAIVVAILFILYFFFDARNTLYMPIATSVSNLIKIAVAALETKHVQRLWRRHKFNAQARRGHLFRAALRTSGRQSPLVIQAL
jgi:hypothetical protein